MAIQNLGPYEISVVLFQEGLREPYYRNRNLLHGNEIGIKCGNYRCKRRGRKWEQIYWNERGEFVMFVTHNKIGQGDHLVCVKIFTALFVCSFRYVTDGILSFTMSIISNTPPLCLNNNQFSSG